MSTEYIYTYYEGIRFRIRRFYANSLEDFAIVAITEDYIFHIVEHYKDLKEGERITFTESNQELLLKLLRENDIEKNNIGWISGIELNEGWSVVA